MHAMPAGLIVRHEDRRPRLQITAAVRPLYRSTVITRMKSVLKYTCIIPVKQLCSKSSDFGNKVIFIPRFTGFHDCIEDRQQGVS